MFRTNQYCEIRTNLDLIKVPVGTKVIPIKGGADELFYAIADDEVLKQQNEHDRKYRYLWINHQFVEEIK